MLVLPYFVLTLVIITALRTQRLHPIHFFFFSYSSIRHTRHKTNSIHTNHHQLLLHLHLFSLSLSPSLSIYLHTHTHDYIKHTHIYTYLSSYPMSTSLLPLHMSSYDSSYLHFSGYSWLENHPSYPTAYPRLC